MAESSTTLIRTREIHYQDIEALITVSILTFKSTKNCPCLEEDLLVSSSKVTSVMDTSFKQQSHDIVTRQHSITHIYFLSGWLPFQRPLLHNWTVGGKVHAIKANCIIEGVAYHSGKREVEHTQRDQAKIREEVLTDTRTIRCKNPSTRGSDTRINYLKRLSPSLKYFRITFSISIKITIKGIKHY